MKLKIASESNEKVVEVKLEQDSEDVNIVVIANGVEKIVAFFEIEETTHLVRLVMMDDLDPEVLKGALSLTEKGQIKVI